MENANHIEGLSRPLRGYLGSVPGAVVIATIASIVLAGLAGIQAAIPLGISLLLVIVALVYSRPILIVYGMTVAMPLTSGLARGGLIPFLRVSQALVVLGFLLMMLAKPTRLGKSRLSVIDYAFALFFVTGAFFPLLAVYARGDSINLGDTSGLYGVTPLQTLLGPVQYYLLYRIVVATISSQQEIKRVVELSLATSIIVAGIGILEEFVEPVRTVILTYYPPPEVGANLRISSTLQHYSGLGAYLAFTMLVALAFYSGQKRQQLSPLLLGATLLIDSVALILTGTISSWIGMVFGTLLVFARGRRIPRSTVLVVVAVAVAVVFFQPFLSTRLDQQLGSGAAQGVVPQSLAFRIQLWQEVFLPAAGQHLLFGAGPAPAVLSTWSTEESQYLRLLLRGGLFYLLSYAFLILSAIAVCRVQMTSHDEVTRLVAIGTFAILVTINIMNISGEYFTFAGATQTLWTMLALVITSRQLDLVRHEKAEKMTDHG